jgi:putative nucleotidyltransferase with HDIG domain
VEQTLTMASVISSMRDLPPMAPVGSRVIKLLADDQASAAELARLLSSEPTLAAKIVRIANSPFYGMAYRIKTIQHALLVIGMRATSSLVLAVTTWGVFRSSHLSSSQEANRKRLLRHSVACGVGTRLLAQGRYPNPEEAFLAGLLHDLGKLVLETCVSEGAAPFLEPAVEIEDHLPERNAFGFDHQDVGAALLNHWGFPSTIAEAIQSHHQPLDPLTSAVRSPLAALIHVAEIICAVCETETTEGGGVEPSVDPAILSALGLREQDLPAIRMDLPLLMAETLDIWEGVTA